MDETVKQFAGYVSEAAGGAAAASSDNDALRWLAAAYELERANNIVYQTPSGFLTPDHSNGQDIKFPRDVFRDKSGTCVDLAIAYAALAEAVGLRANLMVVPGHTFAVIMLPSGKLIPVENTGLAGGVDKSIRFDKAVEYGMEEYQKYRSEGSYYLVNVSDEWTTGRVPNPELQPLSVDFLAQSGIRRMNATAPVVASAPRKKGSPPAGQVAGGQRLGAQAAEEAPQGSQFTVVHPHGMGFCIGKLTITSDSVIFQADQATDGAKRHLEFKKSEMTEYKKNRLPIYEMGVPYPAFHIRLASGLYNFILYENGRGIPPDQVLLELSH
jgi:hypothetical protein